MRGGLSIVEIHGAINTLEGITFDRFTGALEGFGHLLEIFGFKFPEDEIHLSAFWEIVADTEAQSCILLRTEDLRDVFQPIVSGFAARGLEAQLSKGQCEIIDDNQGLLNGNFLLVHPIANSIARKIHVCRWLEQDEGLVLEPKRGDKSVSFVFPSGTGFRCQIVDHAETDVVTRAFIFLSDIAESDDEMIHGKAESGKENKEKRADAPERTSARRGIVR